MFRDWAKRYSLASANSKISSQFGAMMILVFAIMEAIRIVRGSLAVENLSWDAVWSGAVPTSLFLTAFGLRFFLLSFFASHFLVRAGTWWLSFATVWFCLEYFGPEPGVIYSLFHSFPLETSGTIFLFIGGVRFLYFASVSFKNDLDLSS